MALSYDTEGNTIRVARHQQARRKGIYETAYGNAAYVSGPKAKTAYDLDTAERIPITEVTEKFLRKADPQDSPNYRYLE